MTRRLTGLRFGQLGRAPTGWAQTRKHGVMTLNGEPGSLFGDVGGHEGHGDFDIEDDTTGGAMDVVVSLGAPVVPAGLIREREFLDQPMLDEEVQGAVDRAIADFGITLTDTLKDLGGSHVLLGRLHNIQNKRALCGRAECPAVEIAVV
jgi:hypothetical protein